MTLAGGLAGTALLLAFAATGADWMENVFADMTVLVAPVAVLQALALIRLRGLLALAWIPATLIPLQLALSFGFLTALAAALAATPAAPVAARFPGLSYVLFAIGFAASSVPVVLCQWLVLLGLPHAGRWLWLVWLPGVTLGLAFYLEFPFADRDALRSMLTSALAALLYGAATACVLPFRRAAQP